MNNCLNFLTSNSPEKCSYDIRLSSGIKQALASGDNILKELSYTSSNIMLPLKA